MSELVHYGTPRHSGRYPWGTGEDPEQHSKSFLGYVEDLQKQGMSEVEIAKANKMSVTELRNRKTIAKNEIGKANLSQILKLKEKGVSNVAIGEKLGMPESSVRAALKPAAQAKAQVTDTLASLVKDNVTKNGIVDVGAGTEHHVGVSRKQLDVAITKLRDQGYKIQHLKIEQVGNPGKFTDIKVLVPESMPYSEIYAKRGEVAPLTGYLEDLGNGPKATPIEPPMPISSSRLGIKYGPDGGTKMDGVIELRRNVTDLSLGDNNYAQVRVGVDGTHYIKGMAMYSDDLPKGVDIQFNTNKEDTGNKLDALKPMKMDKEHPENFADLPFGSVVRQKHYIDSEGNTQLSPLNIVNEEKDWNSWSNNLSSQFLSKQSPALAERQLGLAFDQKANEFDEISALTNPAIKKKLLDAFADEADSAAAHLKAAALPRQRTAVILPITSLKENEIYAPTFNNGERVVLIRHPHGGKFEIPELVVNNKSSDAKRIIGSDSIAAVGIHPKVAEKLSGADFDGDTVLVIPTKNQSIATQPSLKGLDGFSDALKEMYKLPDSAPEMSAKTKGTQMGLISNLITDMTIKGANDDELARAVRHSMVVIDAEKHHLDYKKSAIDNGINALKAKYQRKENGDAGGASTLISRAKSDYRIPERVVRSAKDGGPVDPNTGAKQYTDTGRNYVIPEHTKQYKNGRTVVVPEKTIYQKTKSTKMAEVTDAFTLSSGTRMESVYATHANKLKSLANTARKESYNIKPIQQNPSAREVYKPEVESLKAKLNIALMNAPLERQAQAQARVIVDAKRKADPNLDASDIKKINGQALTSARLRTGADKHRIDITSREWEAIQSGAISNNFLTQIVNNTDLEKIKELATPRTSNLMTATRIGRAQSMLNAGFTQAEVAQALGVSVSTLTKSLKG